MNRLNNLDCFYFISADFGVLEVRKTFSPEIGFPALDYKENGADLYFAGHVMAFEVTVDKSHILDVVVPQKIYLTAQDALDDYVICPTEGEFFGYTTASVDFTSYSTRNALVKLLIPTDAERTNSYGRMCRANMVKVVSITDLEGNSYVDCAPHASSEIKKCAVDSIVLAPAYDGDREKVCGDGIHFFLTEDEAWNYIDGKY